jgi:hypothetical protein
MKIEIKNNKVVVKENLEEIDIALMKIDKNINHKLDQFLIFGLSNN